MASSPTDPVLVVEDDAAIRRLVAKLLSRRSVPHETVADGVAAVERLRSHSYSLVLLDLMIPGVSGYEIIDLVRNEKLAVPIVVVSAVSQQALKRIDRDVVKAIISKPFDVEEFAQTIMALRAQSEASSD